MSLKSAYEAVAEFIAVRAYTCNRHDVIIAMDGVELRESDLRQLVRASVRWNWQREEGIPSPDRLASLRQVPDGYVLVPSDPTAEMVNAFHAGAGLWNYWGEAAGGLRAAIHAGAKATTAQAGAEFPELPEADDYVEVFVELSSDIVCERRPTQPLYTADQMRAYAELARRGGS